MGMFFKYFPNFTLLNLLYWPNDEQRIILVPSFGLPWLQQRHQLNLPFHPSLPQNQAIPEQKRHQQT